MNNSLAHAEVHDNTMREKCNVLQLQMRIKNVIVINVVFL